MPAFYARSLHWFDAEVSFIRSLNRSHNRTPLVSPRSRHTAVKDSSFRPTYTHVRNFLACRLTEKFRTSNNTVMIKMQYSGTLWYLATQFAVQSIVSLSSKKRKWEGGRGRGVLMGNFEEAL